VCNRHITCSMITPWQTRGKELIIFENLTVAILANRVIHNVPRNEIVVVAFGMKDLMGNNITECIPATTKPIRVYIHKIHWSLSKSQVVAKDCIKDRDARRVVFVHELTNGFNLPRHESQDTG
jgi:hypothetical protein